MANNFLSDKNIAQILTDPILPPRPKLNPWGMSIDPNQLPSGSLSPELAAILQARSPDGRSPANEKSDLPIAAPILDQQQAMNNLLSQSQGDSMKVIQSSPMANDPRMMKTIDAIDSEAIASKNAEVERYNQLKQKIGSMLGQDTRGLAGADLSSVASFVDAMTGSNMAAKYKAPQSAMEIASPYIKTEVDMAKQEGDLRKMDMERLKEKLNAYLKVGQMTTQLETKRMGMNKATLTPQNISKFQAEYNSGNKKYGEGVRDLTEILNVKLNPAYGQISTVDIATTVRGIAKENNTGALTDKDVDAIAFNPAYADSIRRWAKTKFANESMPKDINAIKEFATKALEAVKNKRSSLLEDYAYQGTQRFGIDQQTSGRLLDKTYGVPKQVLTLLNDPTVLDQTKQDLRTKYNIK